MQCGHEGCTCDVTADQEFCSDHCRDHAGMGSHDEHPCQCGHPACQAIGE